MGTGYLLDVNTISRWGSANSNVIAHAARVSNENGLLFISVITLGELEFGHSINLANRDPNIIEAYARWVRETFPKEMIVEVTSNTRHPYGAFRAELFRLFPPLGGKENHPEK